MDCDWAVGHSNASEHVWSDRAERSTFAQTQLNSTKRHWTQQCKKRMLRTREGRMLRTGSAKPVRRLEPVFTAHRLFKREGSCIAKRSWQEHSSHTDEDVAGYKKRVAAKHLRVVKVATGSNPADMLTKTLGRWKMEEFCAEIGQTEPRAETEDKECDGAKKPKEVKFAVETMGTDETVKNKLKDSRIAKAKNKLKDARSAKDKNESKDATLRWMHTVG